MSLRAVLAAGAAAGVAAQLAPCIFSYRGATYDLTSMSRSYGYMIQDSTNKTTYPTYNYWFAVCNDMTAPPGCQNVTNPTAPAWSLCTSGPVPGDPTKPGCIGQCTRLGDTAANQNLTGYPWNPASGLQLQYTNGDNCTSTSFGVLPSSMSVIFQCYPKAGILPQNDEVIPDNACGIHAIVRSSVACPEECAFGRFPKNTMCSSQGVCGYDRSASVARCFCNAGYSGIDCATPGDRGLPASANYSGNIAGGFFGGLVGGLILAFVGVGLWSMRSGGGFLEAFGVGGGFTALGGGSRAAAPAVAAPQFASTTYEAPSVTEGAPTDNNTGSLLA